MVFPRYSASGSVKAINFARSEKLYGETKSDRKSGGNTQQGRVRLRNTSCFQRFRPLAILTGSVVYGFTSREYLEPTPLRALLLNYSSVEDVLFPGRTMCNDK
jgi:hypothetical protein